MNRQHNRTNYTGEEMDLSHLIDSGINGNSNNNTPNNNRSSVKTNSTNNARSNVAIFQNNNRSVTSNNVPNVSDDNDPLAAFIKDPNKASRNLKNEKNKVEQQLKKEREPQQPMPRSNVPEVEGKTTAFIPYQNKDGSISFHSFSIKTKTTTNVTVEHITPPYVNKKNNIQ